MVQRVKPRSEEERDPGKTWLFSDVDIDGPSSRTIEGV